MALPLFWVLFWVLKKGPDYRPNFGNPQLELKERGGQILEPKVDPKRAPEFSHTVGLCLLGVVKSMSLAAPVLEQGAWSVYARLCGKPKSVKVMPSRIVFGRLRSLFGTPAGS